VQQDKCDVRIDLRTVSGWSEQTSRDDPLALAEFGLRGRL
jgi:hypothetical protein